jgi:hypothetical protein
MIDTIFLGILLVWKFCSDIFAQTNRKKVKTVCSHCGIKADDQPIGNGCFTCLRGIMKAVEYQKN